MQFEDIRIKDVHAVLHYTPNMKKWSAKNRKNHFVGIQLGGSALHCFKDHEFVLSGNCVYFFNQREDYDVEVQEAGEAFSVHFTTYDEIETDSFCIPIRNADEIVSLLERCEQYRVSKGGELMLHSTLYKLCNAIAHARRRVYAPMDARMATAREYMDAHFEAADCLHAAIAQSGLSARRFNDLFKGIFGTTPNRYLVTKRIDHAKSMLETQSLTVTEIAELCGFSDVYYFSKVFKQETGISPNRWKG